LVAPLSAVAGFKVLETITAEQARQHIGEVNTVCGLVASAQYMDSWASRPTFLNFDRPYPNQSFLVRIPISSRAAFSEPPEVLFSGKDICVTGVIEDHNGRPEMIVEDPSQILIQQTTATSPGGPVGSTRRKTPLPSAPGATVKRITSMESQQHIGESATVCGLVASARGFESTDGGRSYLNFDRPFPDQTFAVMIEGANRAKFKSPPDLLFNGKTICVTGSIVNYRGRPEIIVEDPAQIVVQH
jgi:DNA/RNA endonuclease YhcR with UshA esterase domain